MFLLDPRRGRARRSRIIDQVTHLRREARHLFTCAAADARHRMQGMIGRVRSPMATDVGDQVLQARVRTQLGRVIGHMSAIEVDVRDGRVELRGPILEEEIDAALGRARAVPGVREVVDRLERHATRDIPSLQGEPARRNGELWPPSAQGLAVMVGLGLVISALVRPRPRGLLTAAAGTALALRGALNQPLVQLARRAVGREVLELEKTIHVRAPVERVFRLWRDVQNFPRFMQHVRQIEIDDRDPMRSHWTVDGFAGRPLAFEAIITRIEHPLEIGWTTPPDQKVEHTGVVRFSATPEGTRVHLYMTYRPPGGLLGNTLARLLGWDPKARIDDDMVRMKGLLEEGHTRAHGERVSAQDLVH